MTARTLYPESRRRPRCIAVALVLLLAMVMAAGCNTPAYHPNRDIGIVKLTSDGLPEWSALVNAGVDGSPGEFFETSDGRYILATMNPDKKNPAQFTTQWIKISHDGAILGNDTVDSSVCGSYQFDLNKEGKIVKVYWSGPVCPLKSTGDFAEESVTDITVRGSVTKISDGGYIIAGYSNETIPFTKDEFILHEQTEFQRSKEDAEERWNGDCGNKNLVRSWYCYKTPVFTPTLAKTNIEGNVLWQHIFQNYSADTISFIEMKAGKGYLVNFGNAAIRFLPDGTVTNVTMLDHIKEFFPSQSDVQQQGNYSLLAREKHTNVALLFDRDGIITGKEYLPGNLVTPTNDGGFFVVYLLNMQSSASSEPFFFATKYHSDGSIAWQKPVISDNLFPQYQTQLIQTSDSGYIVMSWQENSEVKK